MKKVLVFFLALCILMLGACRQENLEPVTWTVNIEKVSLGGEIVLDKEVVQNGKKVTVSIMPDAGYCLSEIFVNGIQKKSDIKDGKLTIDNVTSDITIEAKFENGIAYVNNENAPIIDGTMDDIWQNSSIFVSKNINIDNCTQNIQNIYYKDAEIRVLWNEIGLYFLAYVYDTTVTRYDRCNFWVSENYITTTEGMNVPYSANAQDGNYAICANPLGTNMVYTNLDVSSYWQVATSRIEDSLEDDYGYIVEIFMPIIGETAFKLGHQIGFDISVDYYSAYQTRDLYTNWCGIGKYWENVNELKKVELLP